MSSGNCRPFCLGLNVLIPVSYYMPSKICGEITYTLQNLDGSTVPRLKLRNI